MERSVPELVVGEVQIAQGRVVREPRLVPRGQAVLAQDQNLYQGLLYSESRHSFKAMKPILSL